MLIESTNNARYRNDEHFQFITDFIQTVDKFGAATLKIEPQMTALAALYAKEDEALKKINKSAFTKEIQDADTYRDQIFKGLTATVKAATFHFDKTKQDAATKLMIILNTYGNIAVKPLSEQTSATSNLLQDIRSKNKETTALGITEWANELETANNAVNSLMMDRYEETSLKSDIVLKQVRKEIDALYREITARINALVTIEGTENYVEFTKMLNAVTTRYTNIIAQRTGKTAAATSRQNQNF